MRTSASINTVRVTPISNDAELTLDNLDGFDLLQHFFAYAAKVKEGPGLRDKAKGHYLKVIAVKGRGNSVLLELETGPFGESAITYDTRTGVSVRKNTSDEAFARKSHAVLFRVPTSPYVLFVKEHKYGVPSGWLLFESFKHHLTSQIPNFYLPVETAQEDISWKESADLEEVTVVMHHKPLDISSGVDSGRKNETVAGRLAYSAIPPKGVKTFGKEVRRRLFSGAMDPVTFVGLRATPKDGHQGDGNPDSTVLVKLSRDGRTKTFELGAEGTPMLRESLTVDDEPALDMEQFYKRSIEMAVDFYKREGFTLDRASIKKKWSNSISLPTWPGSI
ncbi:hypothetical protein [Mycetocola sp. JXN-3]|uniref:hypothetical protein n=1 Tax=Mycetocola sp. JXN-3 TaxID=2116510 RepID=UPI00165CF710|nr:hypothetical protein [Mycetocola sp. JXN-3]